MTPKPAGVSVVGIPNDKISDEAVEAAARALCADDGLVWDARSDPGQREYRHNARAALAAAVPYIEAGLREKLATEIEATKSVAPLLRGEPKNDTAKGFDIGYAVGIKAAARVARGTQDATE